MTIYHRKIEHPIIEENYEHQPSVSNWLYLSPLQNTTKKIISILNLVNLKLTRTANWVQLHLSRNFKSNPVLSRI